MATCDIVQSCRIGYRLSPPLEFSGSYGPNISIENATYATAVYNHAHGQFILERQLKDGKSIQLHMERTGTIKLSSFPSQKEARKWVKSGIPLPHASIRIKARGLHNITASSSDGKITLRWKKRFNDAETSRVLENGTLMAFDIVYGDLIVSLSGKPSRITIDKSCTSPHVMVSTLLRKESAMLKYYNPSSLCCLKKNLEAGDVFIIEVVGNCPEGERDGYIRVCIAKLPSIYNNDESAPCWGTENCPNVKGRRILQRGQHTVYLKLKVDTDGVTVFRTQRGDGTWNDEAQLDFISFVLEWDCGLWFELHKASFMIRQCVEGSLPRRARNMSRDRTQGCGDPGKPPRWPKLSSKRRHSQSLDRYDTLGRFIDGFECASSSEHDYMPYNPKSYDCTHDNTVYDHGAHPHGFSNDWFEHLNSMRVPGGTTLNKGTKSNKSTTADKAQQTETVRNYDENLSLCRDQSDRGSAADSVYEQPKNIFVDRDKTKFDNGQQEGVKKSQNNAVSTCAHCHDFTACGGNTATNKKCQMETNNSYNAIGTQTTGSTQHSNLELRRQVHSLLSNDETDYCHTTLDDPIKSEDDNKRCTYRQNSGVQTSSVSLPSQVSCNSFRQSLMEQTTSSVFLLSECGEDFGHVNHQLDIDFNDVPEQQGVDDCQFENELVTVAPNENTRSSTVTERHMTPPSSPGLSHTLVYFERVNQDVNSSIVEQHRPEKARPDSNYDDITLLKKVAQANDKECVNTEDEITLLKSIAHEEDEQCVQRGRKKSRIHALISKFEGGSQSGDFQPSRRGYCRKNKSHHSWSCAQNSQCTQNQIPFGMLRRRFDDPSVPFLYPEEDKDCQCDIHSNDLGKQSNFEVELRGKKHNMRRNIVESGISNVEHGQSNCPPRNSHCRGVETTQTVTMVPNLYVDINVAAGPNKEPIYQKNKSNSQLRSRELKSSMWVDAGPTVQAPRSVFVSV